jgi:hypothetical protein
MDKSMVIRAAKRLHSHSIPTGIREGYLPNGETKRTTGLLIREAWHLPYAIKTCPRLATAQQIPLGEEGVLLY